MDNNYNQQTNENSNQQGNPEQQKAPNIFQQFALSFVPPQYNKLTRVSTGSMIGFVTLLTLVAAIILFITLSIVFAALDVKGWANKLPDFEIRNGHLYLEEEFLFDEGNLFVYMTEDINAFSYEDAAELADEGYQNGE